MEKNILNYNSVENIPHINAKAAFTVNSAAVFREDGDICTSLTFQVHQLRLVDFF